MYVGKYVSTLKSIYLEDFRAEEARKSMIC